MSNRILIADWRDGIASLDGECGQMILTSPPYYGLRDYGVAGQLGLEATPEEYIAQLVAGFGDMKRLIPKDGTLWVNIGDSYAASGRGGNPDDSPHKMQRGNQGSLSVVGRKTRAPVGGLKPKDLIGIPWMLAFALRADGWYWRRPIIWAKPNGMPESTKDRPTVSYEIVHLFAKSERYYYDNKAVRRPLAPSSIARLEQPGLEQPGLEQQEGSRRANGGSRADRPMKAVRFGGTKYAGNDRGEGSENAGNLGALRDAQRVNERNGANGGGLRRERERHQQDGPTPATSGARPGAAFDQGAQLRDVWWIATEPNKEAHFAMMPTALAETCILLGSRPSDTIIDPFAGAGTTALVADRLGRHSISIELNPANAEIIRRRLYDDAPLFAGEVADG